MRFTMKAYKINFKISIKLLHLRTLVIMFK